MDTVLMVAVILITLAVVAQAGVLIAMYLMSRRLTSKAEGLMDESQKLMAPLESIAGNLKTVSEDLTESGKIAREQLMQLQQMLTETQVCVREQIDEVREVVMDTVEEARSIVMRPVRQYSAMAAAIAAGVRTFFGKRETPSPTINEDERQFPAA
jgi:hypothetical protein